MNFDTRRGCSCIGAKGIWEISVLSDQFFCEPKTTLKNKIYYFSCKNEIKQKKLLNTYYIIYYQVLGSTRDTVANVHVCVCVCVRMWRVFICLFIKDFIWEKKEGAYMWAERGVEGEREYPNQTPSWAWSLRRVGSQDPEMITWAKTKSRMFS